MSVAWSALAQLMKFFCSRFLVMLFGSPGISVTQPLYLLSPRLRYFIVLKGDLFIHHDDSLTSKRVIMQTEQPTECFVSLQNLRVRLCP